MYRGNSDQTTEFLDWWQIVGWGFVEAKFALKHVVAQWKEVFEEI